MAIRRADRFWFLRPGSLTQRMLLIAAVWIGALLLAGGFVLDRALTASFTRSFDEQLDTTLTAMIASAELGPDGEVRLSRELGDQRFLEPYSGLYYQVSADGQEPFRSRSLWDRALPQTHEGHHVRPRAYTSYAFSTEPLRIVERDVMLPGSSTDFHFQIAQSTRMLEVQLGELRRTLIWSLSLLGLGLLILAALQAIFGLWPLHRVRHAIARIRSGEATRVPMDFPPEIAPLVVELNALLEHNEVQAEAARMHAGNLAHALKTPMSILVGEAQAAAPDLPRAVLAQTDVMRRHVDHHLARARALGRRAATSVRTEVWPALEALQRATERIHQDRGVTVDIAGERGLLFRGERQDLIEMVGNLIDNAAKYGGGRVFVTVRHVDAPEPLIEISVEDDGPGIPEAARAELFQRGARLDTTKPGTGLGLAIVRDVAEIYGGNITLGQSEDLDGLCATLRLPAVTQGMA